MLPSLTLEFQFVSLSHIEISCFFPPSLLSVYDVSAESSPFKENLSLMDQDFDKIQAIIWWDAIAFAVCCRECVFRGCNSDNGLPLVNGRGNSGQENQAGYYWPVCPVCPQWLLPPSLLPCGGEDSVPVFKVPSYCSHASIFAILILPSRAICLWEWVYIFKFCAFVIFEVELRGGKVVFQVKLYTTLTWSPYYLEW